MGDSEEEYERQRRDKFQRERSDQFERRSRDNRDWNQRDRSRGSWGNSGSNAGDMKSGGMRPMADSMHRRRTVEYPQHGGGMHHPEMKRRYSPDHADDMRGRKRMRPFEGGYDQGAAGWGGGGWDARAMHGQRDFHGGERHPPPSESEKGPRMMTFKQWLNTQPDEITDEEAVTNYTEYKVNFRRTQLQTFFMDHKNEEWFKEKYHPDEADKRYVDQCASIHWRADIFKKLVEFETFQSVALDLDNENDIIKVIDSAVILMEGGNKDDLNILDMDEDAIENELMQSKKDKESAASVKTEETKDDGIGKPMQPDVLTEEQFELKKQAALYKQLVDKKPDNADEEANDGETAEAAENPEASNGDRKDETKEESANMKTEDSSDKAEQESGELPKTEQKPRALHRTHSIFMRNLPPSVTKQEIVNLCKRFPGFIRVAFSNPLLEDRTRIYYRRCWVTFDRSVNIKDICWNLNNLRLRDIELNPVVNRDLLRRVRPISGISQHASCARTDLKNIARLIMHLDSKWKLWEDKSNKEKSAADANKAEESSSNPAALSNNPYLSDLAQYLVDESNAEEEELLGAEEDKEEGEAPPAEQNPVIKITRDDKLLKVLDRLLYYLRIVHSIDYYNALEYPCEDEMPNRVGIVHARGPIPPNMLTKEDINEFQKRFNDKLASILNFKEKLTEDEAKKLGPKNSETEVEKFVQANTQELGKDKWLCPLSGKKFKGPDYIRKHIFNKHGDKIEAVKKEVQYFNNYLMDPRRPTPLDGQVSSVAKPPPPTPPMHMQGRPFHPPPGTPPMFRGDPGRGGFSTPQFQHRPPNPYGNGMGRTYPPKSREMRPSGDPYASRSIVGYQDLDAPEETDFF